MSRQIWILIGFLLLLGVGILLTLYYWKYIPLSTKQLSLSNIWKHIWNSEKEGFQTIDDSVINEKNKQVFLVFKQSNSYDDAANICYQLGARLATLTELHDAVDAGANWCAPGYVNGEKFFQYSPVGSGQQCGKAYGPAVVNLRQGIMANTQLYARNVVDSTIGNVSDARATTDWAPNVSIPLPFGNIKRSPPELKDSIGGMYTTEGYKGGLPTCYGYRPAMETENNPYSGYYVNIIKVNNENIYIWPFNVGSSYSEPNKSTVDIDTILYDLSNNTVVGSIFDTTGTANTGTANTGTANTGTYTILDLDAITTQQNIIMADITEKRQPIIDAMDNRYFSDYESLYSMFKCGKRTYYPNDRYIDVVKNKEEYKAILQSIFGTVQPIAIGSINTTLNIFQIYNDIFMDSDIFTFNPFTIINKLTAIPDATTYKTQLKQIVDEYIKSVYSVLSAHPTAFIANNILNRPVYLNNFKLPDSHLPKYNPICVGSYGCKYGKWKYYAGRAGINQDPCNLIKKTVDYRDISRETDGWTKYSDFIYTEDLQLIKEDFSSFQRNPPYSNFFSKTDGWQPFAVSGTGTTIRNNFITNKNAIATKYGITTNKENTYRWKPIDYKGTISQQNKDEIQASVSLSKCFNFSNSGYTENQIRISSENTKLYYSKNALAKPEYTTKFEVHTDGTPPERTIIPANAGYNKGYCNNALSRANMDLLPYHTRNAISLWAEVRKNRIIDGRIVDAEKKAIAAWNAGIKPTKCAVDSTDVVITSSVLDDQDARNHYTNPNGPYLGRCIKNSSYCAQTYEDGTISLYHMGSDCTVTPSGVSRGRATSVIPEPHTEVAKQAYINKYPDVTNAKQDGNGKSDLSQNYLTDTSNDVDVNGVPLNVYRRSKTKFFSSILDTSIRNTVLNSMAQIFYNLNQGNVRINKILDIFQVGETIFDIRYEERQIQPINKYQDAIKDLEQKYNQYRNYNLSESELNALEAQHDAEIQKLYKMQDTAVYGNASNCGIKARYVYIEAQVNFAFNFSQVIVLNSSGENVAYYTRTTGNLTKLELSESVAGKTIYTGGTSPYPITCPSPSDTNETCKKMDDVTALSKFQLLTDGTYTDRTYPTYKSEKSTAQTLVYIEIDLFRAADITSIIIVYPASQDNTFTIKLLDNDHNQINDDIIHPPATYPNRKSSIQTFTTAAAGGRTTIDFRYQTDAERTANDQPICPTNMYNIYKTARFFATFASSASDPAFIKYTDIDVFPEGYIKFTGFSDASGAALTFSPLYNGGFNVDLTSPGGNIAYSPVIVYNKNSLPTLDACDSPTRMYSIFKDYNQGFIDPSSSKFLNREDVIGLNLYDAENYTYVPKQITAYSKMTGDTNKSVCAYKWTEDKFNSEGVKVGDSINRIGKFVYFSDTENWNSRSIVYDVNKSKMYANDASFTAENPTDKMTAFSITSSATTFPLNIQLPYKDSVTLDTNGGSCPARDCSDPTVINNIVWSYNNNIELYANSSIISGTNPLDGKGAILRVTKAVTTSSQSCEYELQTVNSTDKQKIKFDVVVDNNCVYKIANGKKPQAITGGNLTNQTPLLTRAFHFAEETMKPFKNAFSSVYNDLSGLLQPHIQKSGSGTKNNLINYRAISNTAGGQMRATQVGVLNEFGQTCNQTFCNSQSIVDSLLNYYKSKHPGTIVTKVLQVGMDASGACDFTLRTAPIVFTSSTTPNVTANTDLGQTVGVKAQIKRYLNSCAYFVDTTKSLLSIIPTPYSIPEIGDVIRQDYTYRYRYLKFTVTDTRNTSSTTFSFTGFQLLRDSIVVPWNPSATSSGSISSATDIFAALDISGDYTLTQNQYYYNHNIRKMDCNTNYRFNSDTYTCIYVPPSTNVNKPVTGSKNTPIIIDNLIPLVFTSYAWGMGLATDQAKEPSKWKLEGSNDNTNWTVIDDKTKVFQYFNHTNKSYIPTIYPPPVAKGSQITSAGVKSDTTSLYKKGRADPTKSTEDVTNGTTPLRQGPLKLIDYIDCNSVYAINKILANGISSITKIANIDLSSCYVEGTIGSNSVINKYVFSKSVRNSIFDTVSVTPTTSQTFTYSNSYTFMDLTNPVTIPSVSPAPNFTLSKAHNADCMNDSLINMTGFNTIIDASGYQITLNSTNASSYNLAVNGSLNSIINMCDYKISNDTTLSFGDLYKRVLFSNGTPVGTTQLHVASITRAIPANSPFSLFYNYTFSATAIASSNFISMITYLYSNWNGKFYGSSVDKTGWKIGCIKTITLASDLSGDVVIFDASGCKFGEFGENDIRDYNDHHYFKFTLRQDDPTNTNNSRFINGKKYILYSMSDSATAYTDTPYTTPITVNLGTVNDTGILTNGAIHKDSNLSDMIFPIQTISTSQASHRYRFVRFRPTNTTNNRVELTRLLFYQKTGGVFVTTPISLPKATIIIDDISSNYLLGQYKKPVCDVGYTTINDPVKGVICQYSGQIASYTIPITTANPDTNRNIACGIGYYQSIDSNRYRTCTSTGFYLDVITDPKSVSYLNEGQPRLRLEYKIRPAPLIGQYQAITINFNEYVVIDGFSFITGSIGTRPMRWTLEASKNGKTWFTINSQTTDYSYGTTRNPFYTPGIFPIDTTTNTNLTATNASDIKLVGYTDVTPPTVPLNIVEGFRANLLKPVRPVETMKLVAPPVALEPAYNLPLKMENPLELGRRMQVVQKRRIQQLRFRILETHDPASKFVNMSQLEFHTRAGVISPSCFKISNPQGSRKNPKEGVSGLLGTRANRWVDFNKSELIIQFDTEILPTTPIIGFKFSVPEAALGLGATPAKWILLGSYDKREWIPLHENTEYKAHITGVTSPVYKLYEEI